MTASLVMQRVAAREALCSCLTKTPDIQHHRPDCAYRIHREHLIEMQDLLDEVAARLVLALAGPSGDIPPELRDEYETYTIEQLVAGSFSLAQAYVLESIEEMRVEEPKKTATS